MLFHPRSRRCYPGSAALIAMLIVAAAQSAAGPTATTGASVPAAPPAGVRRPMPRPVPDDPTVVTDEQIDTAIRRGVKYLLSIYAGDNPPAPADLPVYDRTLGVWGLDLSYEGGPYSLAVYALLESGLAVKDPRLDPRDAEMKAMIERMKRCNPSGSYETYTRGIRATALAVYDRPEDHDALMADAYWLVSACDAGAYTYTDKTPKGVIRKRARQPANPTSLEEEVRKAIGKTDASAGGDANEVPPGQPDYSLVKPDPSGTPGQLARKRALAKTFNEVPDILWDNSNSQYGLLGVWSAAEAGVEIPEAYWRAVDRHWTMCQLDDGSWIYCEDGDFHGVERPHLSMTTAGLASLMVTHQYLDPPRISDRVGRNPYGDAETRALGWFEHGDNAVTIQPIDGITLPSYILYGMERVGLISGFKHFGKNDWYKLIARRLVDEQAKDGSWAEGVVETSYCLLCLARGRHPVLMSKLRFDGKMATNLPGFEPQIPNEQPPAAKPKATPPDNSIWTGYWANRPRDAANLARFVGKQLERRFNWEVVNVALDWTDWTDAPVLELASHTAPEFTSRDIDMIRQYILAGGLLFTQADGNSEIFNRYAAKLSHQLFPQYPMVDVPPGSPLYTNETVYNIRPRPPLKMVSNGSRILMLHSPTDITRWWQQRDDIRHKDAFQLGMNLFVYAAGKQNFRNRLQETWVTRPAEVPIARVGLARVSYAGNWDPEPFAWRRYANWMQRRTGTRIDTRAVAAADLGALDPIDCPLAHLTGTARQNFTRVEISAIRQYVRSGGVLLIDPCGGMGTFDQSAEALLAAAFSGQKLAPLPVNHPLLKLGNPGTQDVSKPLVRAEVVARYGRGAGVLRMISYGKGHVLYTPLDITSGLLGTWTLGILGYDPDYAQALVKNIVFWTLDGRKEE